MASESWLVTALPYSASPADPFHVSLFITHRLTPDGAEGKVGAFPQVRAWTARLAQARVRLRGGGGPGGEFDIAATPLLQVLDTALWRRVFPQGLPVRPWKVPNRTAAPWQSFAAHRMQAYGLLTHALAISTSPVTAPGVDNNLFVSLVLGALGMHPRQLPLGRVIDGEQDHAITKLLDALNGGRVGGDRQPVRD